MSSSILAAYVGVAAHTFGQTIKQAILASVRLLPEDSQLAIIREVNPVSQFSYMALAASSCASLELVVALV